MSDMRGVNPLDPLDLGHHALSFRMPGAPHHCLLLLLLLLFTLLPSRPSAALSCPASLQTPTFDALAVDVLQLPDENLVLHGAEHKDAEEHAVVRAAVAGHNAGVANLEDVVEADADADLATARGVGVLKRAVGNVWQRDQWAAAWLCDRGKPARAGGQCARQTGIRRREWVTGRPCKGRR